MSKANRFAIWLLIGDSSSLIGSSLYNGKPGAGGLEDLRTEERPDSLRSKTAGKVMPPPGPKDADFSPLNMCGEEVECFNALLCASWGTIAGDCGSSRVGRPAKSFEFVFRLRLLGFLFMAGIFGFMNDGDEGSEGSVEEAAEGANGGCIDRPFMFLRLGAGDVIGRLKRGTCSKTVRLSIGGRAPKVVPGKALRGTKLTGESGEDEGEGSESDEESVHDTVVVGDESADSRFCIELLSRCWWLGATTGGCNSVVESGPSFGLQVGSISIILGSTTVTVSWSSESCML